MNNIFTNYLFFVVPFIIFAIILPLFSILLLPSIVLLIARKFISKSLKYRMFLPYILSIVFFTLVGVIVWEKWVFNNIYYEWDRIYLPAFNLLYHESPILDGSASWIAPEWTLLKLDILYYFMVFCVYFSAVIFSIWYYRKRSQAERSFFLKIITISSVILFTLAIVIPPTEKVLFQFLPNGNQNLKRVENTTACINPTEKDRILFGGNLADHISSKDGSNMKEFWKTTYSGVSSGIPSPDGVRVTYLEKDGIWIKCTKGEGQILIPFDGARINNKDFSGSELMTIPYWSPDGKNLVVNYYGDLLLVNAVTKEKTTVKQKVAFKNYGIDLTRPRPSGYLGQAFKLGTVFWSQDNIIYYSQFKNDTVELHQFVPDTKQDNLILTSKYPLYINNITPDGKLLIFEGDWNGIRENTEYHQRSYLYNLQTSQEENNLYGFNVDTDGMANNFVFSKDGKYMLYTNSTYGLIDSYNSAQFIALDINSLKKYDIKAMVKDYLQKNGELKDNEVVSIDFFDWSSDDSLLLNVRFENERTQKSYVMKLDGTITPISQDSKLIPHSWL